VTDPKGARALLDLKRAADLVGIKGKWRHVKLQRLVEAKEAALGRPILLRYGGKGRGTRYRVTLSALREACPELFTRRDELAEEMQESFERFQDQIAELYERQTIVARELGALKRTVAEIARVNVG
jgi:hypothetical protein